MVFVTRGNGKFIPREVTIGISIDGGKIHVLSGLMPGETVVTSGQFLLDSESKLKEATLKMLELKKDKSASQPMTDHDNTMEEDFFTGAAQ